jgi:hypothetical protein
VTSHRRAAAWLALVTCLPSFVLGQTIRGMVVDRADLPISGVVTQLVDSALNVAGRSLSNERGEFRLAAARAGTYRVQTMRIGYRPATSDPVVLVAGGEITQRVVLTDTRLLLDTMRIVSQNVCRAFTDSGAATFAVWDQVRTALTAVELTGNGRNIAATTIAYERTLESDGRRVREQRATVHSGYVTQPWLTLSPDSLRRVGYVVTDRDNATIYYAPGLDALLSSAFVEDHCFRLVSDNSRLGIVFEPAPNRRDVAELRGTLWLDRASSELRNMEFRYANVSAEQESNAGGLMEFARLANGAWAISRWDIRMPVIEQRIRSQAFGGAGTRVTEIRVAGGELALARRGNDTLWSQPPLVLTGTVIDSISGSSVAAARVSLSGTALAGITDARGRFDIRGVLPGEYTVEVRTPSLDSVSAVHQSPLMFIDGTKPVELRIPNGQQVGALLCGNRRLDPAGIVVGHVSVRGDSLPPRNVKIAAEWTEVSLHASDPSVVSNQRRYLDARGDSHGMFRLCGVPVNTALLLRASADSASSSAVPVRIPANGRFARAELTMDPQTAVTAVFSGLVLTDSTQRPISDAEVVFPELSKLARTDERGAFRVGDIPPGEHRVIVRRVGFGPLDTRIAFASSQNVIKRILLSRAVALDSVVVTAKATDMWVREFEENRRAGFGHFFDRAELAKREGRSTSSVLAEIPGLNIVNGNGTHAWVGGGARAPFGQPTAGIDATDKAKGAKNGGCYAQVYLDQVPIFSGKKHSNGGGGLAYDPLFDVNTIAPDQIEAIEYYADRAETPGRYSGPAAACGVLIIHTRRNP